MTILAESYLHRLDPVALRLSDDWGIRWYGLAYLAGFVIAWLLIRWMSKTKRTLVPESAVGDMLVYAVVGVLVGGRLGYAIFYRPEILITFDASPPWWELLAIHRGGMASHGGIIGVVIAMIIFARRHTLPSLHLIDLMAFIAPPGLFLGRIANFINGELWGKAVQDAWQLDPPWWSIKYPDEVLYGQIDLSNVGTATNNQQVTNEIVFQSLMEGDQVLTSEIVPMLTAWWPSQLIQAICEGPILMVVLVLVWLSPRRPGIISGWFLLTYGALRICTEIVRQPDEGIEIIAGLQRGQLLSVAMVLGGLTMILICRNRSVPAICGLFKRNKQ